MLGHLQRSTVTRMRRLLFGFPLKEKQIISLLLNLKKKQHEPTVADNMLLLCLLDNVFFFLLLNFLVFNCYRRDNIIAHAAPTV